MANEPRNLYAYVDFFRLIYEGNPVYIDEPVDWDKVKIKLSKEDNALFGMNYEFVDPKTTVLFEWGITDTGRLGGGDILRTAYNLQGVDAKVGFEYGYEYKGVQQVQYSGTIAFSEYRATDKGVSIQIEKILFDRLLRTRSETKVALNATVDLNGVAMVPPAALTLQLHSKKIIKYGALGPLPEFETPRESIFGGMWWIQPDTLNTVKSEVDELENMPFAIAVDPLTEDRFQYTPTESGPATLRFTQSFRLVCEPVMSGPLYAWKFTPDIVVRRNGVIVQRITNPGANASGYAQSAIFVHDFNFTIEGAADLQANDQVFFRMLLQNQSNGQSWHIENYSGSIEVTHQTTAAASDCAAYKIFDAFNTVIQAITGRENAFRSDFFAPGGAGERYAVTNGFQIRKFDIAERPVSLSYRDLWEMFEPLFCLGVQYQKDAAGFPIVRIEPGPRFYGTGRILDITQSFDYEEIHNKAVTFNEAEIGFLKYSDDEFNSLDDFSTLKTLLLPIESVKLKYQKKSTGIASGWALETQRREQFKLNPSSSVTNDEALFIVAYVERSVFRDVPYSIQPIAGGAAVYFGRALFLEAGTEILIAGQTLTITKAIDSFSYEVSAAGAANGRGEVEILLHGKIAAERNEAFDVVTGVASPETAYNLRLQLNRVLYNHSEVLNIALVQKPGDAEIKVTDQKKNTTLATQFNALEPFKLTDGNPLLDDKAPVKLQDFNSRRALYLPTLASFKCEMRYNDLIFLKDCLTGQSGTDKDYGLISFPDIFGGVWEGYVEDLTYDPNSEKCEIIASKKRKIA